jgi:hypothetical protein
MKKVYIIGPMRGQPYYNFPQFDAAATLLRSQGYEVRTPSEMDRTAGFDAMKLPKDYDWQSVPDNFSLNACVDRDIEAVKWSTTLYALRGWQDSTGARAEHALGVWLGKEVLYQDGGEERVVDKTTGGEKGSKLARFDLLPIQPLWELAELYGVGSKKYAPRNWQRGYAWSLSYAAAMRHSWQFWGGEDVDPETRAKHIIAAAWHMLALAEFMITHPELDDRPSTLEKRKKVANAIESTAICGASGVDGDSKDSQ